MIRRATRVETDAAKIVKSTQEQAIAAWVTYLNQLRIDRLITALRQQEVHLHEALASIDEALAEIKGLVGSNRGGQRGMHGFIAEVAEVGIGNARSFIEGGEERYQWVNDNGPVDIIQDGIGVQQKFSQAGGRFGLNLIAEHIKRYPDFIETGHKYQIPHDFYEEVRTLYKMPPEEARKVLSRAGGGPSFTEWQHVQEFFENQQIPFESLEPSLLNYGDVQQGTFEKTLAAEKGSLTETDRNRRASAYKDSMPSLKEGAQATVVGATVEGGSALFLALARRMRSGKRLCEFTTDDWISIGKETGLSSVQGGARVASVYALTNFAATPAAVASSVFTAAIGIAEQAHRLRCGAISEQEFIENAGIVTLEAAVSALSSVVGQKAIPIPILGALIGRTVGNVMYKAASKSLSSREAELIERYLQEQRDLDERLAAEHQGLVDQLDAAMSEYVELISHAFSPDPQIALDGSISLALELGVASEEILDTEEKLKTYFLD